MQSSRLFNSGRPGDPPPDDSQATTQSAALQHGATEERSRWRVYTIVGVFAVIALMVLAQLMRYQIFTPADDDISLVQAQEDKTRGIIVDSTGEPLVVNRYYFQLTVTPANIKTPEARHELAQQLLELVNLPYEQTFDILTESPEAMYAVLADAITLEDAQKIAQAQAKLYATGDAFALQHVEPVPMTKRYYPQAELTSHLLGFVPRDRGGITGVEQYYDEFLKRNGVELTSDQVVNVTTLPAAVQRFVPSPVGKDLVLTLDSTVQWILHEELAKGLAEYGASSGSAIAMNPQTGAILGMVNLPDFDPNRYEEAAYELYSNPAISAQYEPGSIFKIITVAAAMDSEILTPSTIYTDTGSYSMGGRVFFNSTRMAYGAVPVTEALARSLNVVTSKIAEDLGPERFYRYVRLFGFDEATNVDLSGEIDGIIKTPKMAEWSLADLGTNSFGQGIACTPLQMLNATAVIANGGRLMRPYIVDARVMGNQVQRTEPEVVRQVLRPETAAAMAEMMAEVVRTGNSAAAVAGYRVAGKSGTAQIPSPTGYEEVDVIASFVGFAPADAPVFALLVKIDRPDPETNPWAGQTAAPVFSRISQRLLDHFNVPPDEVRLASISATDSEALSETGGGE